MENLKIENVEVFLTAPNNIDLVVVRIKTNKEGLYGLGCATYTQRIYAVKTTIEKHLKPFLINKNPSEIEDIWHSTHVSGYWRNGPVLNNALSGVDMALWDIKGKIAELPLYSILGGKTRDGVALYRHTDGATVEEVEKDVEDAIKQGYQYVRCQMGMYGGAGTEDTSLISQTMSKSEHQKNSKIPPNNLRKGQFFDPDVYITSVIELFEYLRKSFGNSIEFIHDIHERLSPIKAIQLAKKLEKYNLFYLEDPFSPEQTEWLGTLRRQTAIPIAIGELFSHPNDWKDLITKRRIDFIRAHISAIGGITPAKKLANLAELYDIRTAWHGPGDLSPIGISANLHLDFSILNFGVQEWTPMNDNLKKVFPGGPTIKSGYAYLTDQPGLGIDFDEEEASKFPPHGKIPEWTLARLPDGTSVRP